MKQKVCKSCKFFYEGDSCPSCKDNKTATTWQGRLHVLEVEKSDIAKAMNITHEGEYAIKIR